MTGVTSFSITVAEEAKAVRLDAYITTQIPGVTRTQTQRLILAGQIRVDGAMRRPAYRIKKGDRISGVIPALPQQSLLPEPRDLDVVYEDETLIVLNKPKGLVVHPAPGHLKGTLVNALLFRYPEIQKVGDPARPGIVHRLDKDTSGLLLVARTSDAHQHLIRQFKSRQVIKCYLAVVCGVIESDEGSVSLPIGRHPRDRKRMSTVSPKGRVAQTEWRIRERFSGATLLEIELKTGRTHQIRVHCAMLGHPVAGDALYGKRSKRAKRIPLKADVLYAVKRQMLHSWRLRVIHPTTLESIQFEAPIPKDMQELIGSLRESMLQDKNTLDRKG